MGVPVYDLLDNGELAPGEVNREAFFAFRSPE